MKNFLKKLTFFDKLVILVALFGLLFLIYLLFRKSSYLDITVKVNEDDINYVQWAIEDKGSRSWFSHLFYVGMIEKSGFGSVNAEVTDVNIISLSPAKEAVYLKVKLKTVYTKSQSQHNYKGSPVLIGYPIKMYLDSVYVEGLVVGINGFRDPREKVNLKVEAKLKDDDPKLLDTTGVEKFIADSIQIGDEIKDSSNNTILKIIAKRVEKAKRIVSTSDGRVFSQDVPNLYDVYLELEVNAIKISDKYFIFDDFPILVGEEIPINTSTYSILPIVSKIIVD